MNIDQGKKNISAAVDNVLNVLEADQTSDKLEYISAKSDNYIITIARIKSAGIKIKGTQGSN